MKADTAAHPSRRRLTPAPQDESPPAETHPEERRRRVSKDGPQAEAAATLIREGTTRLRQAGIENPRGEARLLLETVSGLSREWLIADADQPIAPEQARTFRLMLRRRMNREPMAYIRGEREFFSLSFKVTPGVLIPRPDSECLIEAALGRFPDAGAPLSVLDLGTGSGCLLLSFLSERPHAQGLGVDVSEDALGVARENAGRLGLASRARFLRSDWFSAVKGSFDLVLANPPYIAEGEMAGLAPDVAGFEPGLALCGGQDGLAAYREILLTLRYHLSETGLAVIEIGAGQADAVNRIAASFGLLSAGMAHDLSGRPRGLLYATGARQKNCWNESPEGLG